MIYTGAGWRKAPTHVLEMFIVIGESLAKAGWTLRSGGSGGCDTAFEKGCRKVNGTRQIFLPWYRFNQHDMKYADVLDKNFKTSDAYRLAREFHPTLDTADEYTKMLMCRNSYMLFGSRLDTPSDLLICYSRKDDKGKDVGGTSQAIRIAKAYGIPVLNFSDIQYNNGNKLFLDNLKIEIQKAYEKHNTK